MTDDDRIIRPALSIGDFTKLMGLAEYAAAVAHSHRQPDAAHVHWALAERVKAAMREAQR